MKLAGMLAVVLSVALAGAFHDAEAKRLGGGKSFGAQRQSVAPSTPPAAAPSTPAGAASQPVMPAKPAAPAAGPAAAAKPAAAPSGLSRWMGPLAGLAAGLGLAALLSHFGLSEGFASLLLIGLLVLGAIVVVRMLLARRAPAKPAMQYAGPSGLDTKPGGYETQPAPVLARESRIEPSMTATPAATPAAHSARPLPEGFDAPAFIEQAKQQFKRLQAAYDTADRRMLADVMTPEMTAQVLADIAQRGDHRPTEVVALDAEVLEVRTAGRDYWASVRFTGSLREDGTVLPTPIDEVWNLTKPVDGSSGWLLAGIEQVQTA